MGQYVTIHGDVVSHVNISRVRIEDGGQYTCAVANRAGTVRHAARLNVYGKIGFTGMDVRMNKILQHNVYILQSGAYLQSKGLVNENSCAKLLIAKGCKEAALSAHKL